MHEVGIVQSTLAMAERHARNAGGSAISSLLLRVGDMTGVVPEAIEHAFDVLKIGTLAENASLVIERVGGIGWCEGCSLEFSADGWIAICPRCAVPTGDLRSGLELELVSLEVS
jgi:hydrogenase nickel incorporation protein HypA/HybF